MRQQVGRRWTGDQPHYGLRQGRQSGPQQHVNPRDDNSGNM
jgi:hypothetical protein